VNIAWDTPRLPAGVEAEVTRRLARHAEGAVEEQGDIVVRDLVESGRLAVVARVVVAADDGVPLQAGEPGVELWLHQPGTSRGECFCIVRGEMVGLEISRPATSSTARSRREQPPLPRAGLRLGTALPGR
jgi:hypothetical protein